MYAHVCAHAWAHADLQVVELAEEVAQHALALHHVQVLQPRRDRVPGPPHLCAPQPRAEYRVCTGTPVCSTGAKSAAHACAAQRGAGAP
eukprot:2770883-Rhodomonas_salina.1